MKNNLLLFLLIFSVGIIFTYPAFPTSHALDSYCTMCKGYSETGICFLQNGRVFSYLFFTLFGIIKLPFHSLGFISAFIGNIILSFNIIILYNELQKNLESKNMLYNILLLFLLFLLYFSPLYTSILLLDEAFVIDLGILFLTLSSIFMLKNKLKYYLVSLLFTILGIMCYQGIASYLLLSLLLLVVSNKNYRNNMKFYLKNLFYTTINYGIAFLCNFLLIRLVSSLLNAEMPKLGEFNILNNLNKIINNLFPTAVKYLFGFVNVKYYYGLVIIIILISIIYIVKSKEKLNKILTLILLIASCILVPFIPNMFMSSTSNYTEARMTLTLGILPATLVIYILFSFKINKKMFYSLCFISSIFFLISLYSIHQNMMIDLKRYKYDVIYINNISSNISSYEEKNNKFIDTIYYAYDSDVAYYYSFGNANGANIRLNAVDWALECALQSALNRELNFEKMSEEEFDELFGGLEFDDFNNDQLVYKENALYLLIY